MKTPSSFAAKFVLWLIAITIPVQGFPAVPCRCEGALVNQHANTPNPGCCCGLAEKKAGTCCCSNSDTASKPSCCDSCCGNAESECPCGGNCRCGKSEPPQPLAPVSHEYPVEKAAPETNFGDRALLLPTPKTPELDGSHVSSSTATALDRCATLCRFTL